MAVREIGRVRLVVVFLAALAAGCRPPTPVPSTPPVVDLWEAYREADVAARAEAGDAKLVSASAQWQGVDAETLLAGTGRWSFVFYSAQEQAVLDVVVDTAGAQVVNRTRVWTPPRVLELGAWREGPRDALSIFLAYGGREFLERYPEAVVSLHLGATETGGARWSLDALDLGSRETLSVRIDAESMQVLPTSP